MTKPDHSNCVTWPKTEIIIFNFVLLSLGLTVIYLFSLNVLQDEHPINYFNGCFEAKDKFIQEYKPKYLDEWSCFTMESKGDVRNIYVKLCKEKDCFGKAFTNGYVSFNVKTKEMRADIIGLGWNWHE